MAKRAGITTAMVLGTIAHYGAWFTDAGREALANQVR
jgi:hypothetical protein